jgi:hypothetical protein
VEIVQLYIRDEYSSVSRPVKELKDFAKIDLVPGETKTITLTITPDKLGFLDKEMNWVIEPGTFQVMAGSSSDDKDLKTTILTVIEGERKSSRSAGYSGNTGLVQSFGKPFGQRYHAGTSGRFGLRTQLVQ